MEPDFPFLPSMRRNTQPTVGLADIAISVTKELQEVGLSIRKGPFQAALTYQRSGSHKR
jgi:hypothetical protein